MPTGQDPDAVRVCLVYDCLYPHTVGGAERWYRNLAERLVNDGHEVTYLTLRQWDRGERPDVPGVRVVTAGPRMSLYAGPGRRRILPPLLFGLGVLLHLLRHRRSYDVVHTASFPYFSLLAAALVRPLAGYRIVVDWHEVWSRAYWREYLGKHGGAVGWSIQRACARVRQQAFCFSQLHAARLRDSGLRGGVIVLRGEYAGGPGGDLPRASEDPLVVFAGRLIPEKRVRLAVDAVAAAAARIPALKAVFYGEGPEQAELHRAIEEHGLQHSVRAPGFAPADEVQGDLGRALCMLLPSRREGYGMVVVEAASHATPSVLVAGEDNAATELIDDGVNGLIVAQADADAIAEAIVRVHQQGLAMRDSTATWFARNAQALSVDTSLLRVLESYRPDAAVAPPPLVAAG